MILYALVADGAIERVNIQLPITIGNTSIPAGSTNLEQFGLYPIEGSEPAYDSATHRLTGPQYWFDGTVVQRVYVVEDIPVAELMQQMQRSVVEATQQRLDAFAKTRNYDGILSACTYATSAVPKFQAEGQYCVDARDATWATLYQLFNDVTAGVKPMPASFSDIGLLLPTLKWPA